MCLKVLDIEIGDVPCVYNIYIIFFSHFFLCIFAFVCFVKCQVISLNVKILFNFIEHHRAADAREVDRTMSLING